MSDIKIIRLYNTILVNTSSQIAAKIVTVILGFLMVGLLTRYLGVAQYGIYNLVFVYLSFFGIFADFGLQLTLIRDLPGNRESSNNLKSIYFSLKILLTIISILLALIVLVFLPYSQNIKTAIIVGALAVGLGQINAYGASVLQSKVRLNLVAIIEIINRSVTVIAIIIFVFLHWGLYAIIISVFIGNFVSIIINIYFAPSYYRVTIVPSLALILKIIKVTFPVGVTSLFAMMYFKIDTLMLSTMKTTTDVGIYSLSYKLFENIIMLWSFYMASVYPLMARTIQKNEQKKLNLILKMSFIVLIVFSLVSLLIGFIAAPQVIDILGGKYFDDSILPFRILLFALPMVFINNIFYFFFLSYSRVKWILVVLLVSIVFNIIVNLLLIPWFGYIGTSVSTVTTELIVTIGYLFMFIKFTKLKSAKIY